MTEKRFKFIQDSLVKADVFDNDEFVCCTLSVWVEQLVDLLNQLNDENEQLKQQLQNISMQRDEFHRGATENANHINKLKEENEQLNQKHRQLQIDFNELVGINTDYRELTYDLTDLIEDLGSEEMKRQMYEILKKSHISEFKCWAVKGE